MFRIPTPSLALGVLVAASSSAVEPFPSPEPHAIDHPGIVSSVHAADLDGDGDLDVVAGVQSDDALAWYKNFGDGEFSGRFDITNDAPDPMSLDTADFDQDGDLDLVSASRGDQKIAWYENRGGLWGDQRVLTTFAYRTDWVRAADLDGDSLPDVVWGSREHRAPIAWHRNLGNGDFSSYRVLNTAVPDSTSIRIADVDDDGDADLVWISTQEGVLAWQANQGNAEFADHRLIGTTAGHALLVEDLDLDGDPDLVANAEADADGATRSVWYENLGAGEFALRDMVDDGPEKRDSYCAADLDGDGDTDVCSVSYDDPTAWYENLGGGDFSYHVVSTARLGGLMSEARDLDDDGDADLLIASYYRGLLWFENRSTGDVRQPCDPNDGTPTAAPNDVEPRAGFGRVEVRWQPVPADSVGCSPVFRYIATAESPQGAPTRQCVVRSHVHRCVIPGLLPGATYAITVHAENAAGSGPASVSVMTTLPGKQRGTVAFSDANVLATDAEGAASVHAADFDRDGDLDVVAASSTDDVIAWQENLGAGSFSARRTISTAVANVEEIHAADLDNDGWPDVLSASFDDDKIAWYRNERDGGFSAQRVITLEANGARFVHAADLDADGDADVLSASWLDDRIAWYENDGTGTFSEQRTITTDADVARAVHAADLDLDGDLDVLSASGLDDKIAWYENEGNGSFSAQRIIADDAWYAVSVFAADFDADGDPDVVAAAERGDEITWYRNEGGGVFSDPRIVAEGVDGPLYVHAADVDGDRDPDVIAVSVGDDRVAWYENLGAGVFGPERVVSTSQDDPWSVHAADMDGDGDIDLLTASKGDDTVAWYENLGLVPTAPVLSPGNVRPVAGLETISVTWDPVPVDGDGGTPILRYVVVAVPEIGPGVVTCTASADEAGCVLADLTPGVAYSITVRAENEHASGPTSFPLTVRSVCSASIPRPLADGAHAAVRISSQPADADGEPQRPARATVRWSSPSAEDYSVTVDDADAFACPSSGSVAADEEIETTLVGLCPGAGQRNVTVTITAGDATATATWHVQCSDGNAFLLAVEHYQGPMARAWRTAEDRWDVYTPSLAGRRTALVVRIGHDTAAAPGVSVRVLDDAGVELASALSPLLDSRTSTPRESASRVWETEHVFDVPGNLYLPKNRTRFDVDPTDVFVETDETDNAADLAIEAEDLPGFRIVFIPIDSVVGEPAAIDAETYVTHIHDFFPIADDYVAEVGETFVHEADSWDQLDAATELLHLWNAEADGDEYWHGIYKYPRDGSSCGLSFLGHYVSVGGSIDDGCSRNISVHELGHNFNLLHPRDGCGTGNVDLDFPYDASGIGPRRGWFFSAARFVNPDDGFADTMSYCGPDYFISDYHYKMVFNHLKPADDAGTIASADVRPPIEQEPLTVVTAGTSAAKEDVDPASAPRSIAVTGVVDAWGIWSVRRATISDKAPRAPTTREGRYEILVLDALGTETHSESLALHASSHGYGSSAWTVRMPIPSHLPPSVIIRDNRNRNDVLRQDLGQLVQPLPDR